MSAGLSSAGGRIAVTGALGFVASRLIPRLHERGVSVIAVVRPGRAATRLERLGVEVRRADLARRVPDHAFEGATALVHLAGMAQTPALLPALEHAGVRRGVFVSSAGVHTRLRSSGADAKRRGEAALRRSQLQWTILRPSMIYGTPADRNIARLLRWLSSVPFVPVPGGSTLQQPVHVDDLVAAILAALEAPAPGGREYDVGGPEPLALRDLIRVCAEELGRRVWILPLPRRTAHGAVRLARALKLPCPVRPEQVLRLGESKAVDIGPARRELDFRPRSFRDGIRAEIAALTGRASGARGPAHAAHRP